MNARNYKFKRMFEFGSMGPLRVKNRLVMAPMGTRLANEVGGVSQRQIDYYAERAKGGVGTIIVEITGVDFPVGVASPKTLTIHDNIYIGGHNDLVEAVHAFGARIISQLGHVGRNRRAVYGAHPVAPSPIPCKFFGVVPRELTIPEIEDIVGKFVEAARRAETAGYDGVELHGAHGYLITEFMSASSNHRKDRYGGDLCGRMTFPLEIIQGIRKELGPDYPILFRFSADEFVDGGMNLEESKKVAVILEEAGVHALDVSAGTYDSMSRVIEPMSYPEGWKIYLAESIKKVVKIPVIGVGQIRTPEFAEGILEEGKVDFVALGRGLLADPYWPRKAKEGKGNDIIPCISCNDGCIGGRTFRNLHIRCTVNPTTGRERFVESLKPVSKRKKVVVVGGGPTGIMAALTASTRGHRVTLFEKTKGLGGQLLLSAKPLGKEKISRFRDYLLHQINQQEIKVELGYPVTKEAIVQEKPDVVILATGAVPLVPDLPGIKDQSVCTAWEVLEGKKKVEEKMVLIVGGGTVGCETALYLAPNNKKVTIIEMLNDIALDMEFLNRMDLMSKIQEAKIEVLLGSKVERIGLNGVVLSNEEKEEEELKADAVVLAMGAVPVNDLAKQLEGKIEEIHVVGDCHQPRKIFDAVYEGFRAAIGLT
jgi:2,4-dienoyl-CoA reductase-like NADH-dependent reductase (Old Yellow Enzyme family)/thioredoxin reductase